MRTYCFDLDGTLCTLTGGDYWLAAPIVFRIHTVNALHSQGHVIKIFTARGATTGKDWGDLTRDQLRAWGVRYDELIFGKPHADFFIDDKATRADDFDWAGALGSGQALS